MSLSRFWCFRSDDAHDDDNACLAKLNHLELVVARIFQVERMHYGMREQDDGSLTIKGTIQFWQLPVVGWFVESHFEGFTVTPVEEADMVVFDNMIDRTCRFTITAVKDYQVDINGFISDDVTFSTNYPI